MNISVKQVKELLEKAISSNSVNIETFDNGYYKNINLIENTPIGFEPKKCHIGIDLKDNVMDILLWDSNFNGCRININMTSDEEDELIVLYYKAKQYYRDLTINKILNFV